MPSRGDLNIYQGDDYAAVVKVTDAADDSPIDLTGATAQAQIREGPADDYPEIVAEIGTTVQLPNLILLAIPAAATLNLCGTYVWDLQLSGGDFIATTIMTGKAIVTAEVTRAVNGRRRLAHA